ncbi:MAG: T9SS type A sorting domain-containing protein [Phaeodactylibacter sp.]|nr:T9SS type A sorting domain-containing protein [Phaeodactylibacter sp.]MCB9293861.1 T9SS type A sorting domain-containing protein [Lewinellaceae bacterium]
MPSPSSDGTPPFNGGYDGYAEIVVDNIVYENVTSSGEVLQGKEVQAFPNPVAEATWVKTETGEPIRAMNVFNSNGEVLLSAAPCGSEHLLDVRSLPAGVYWMEIALPGRRVVRQWMKK